MTSGILPAGLGGEGSCLAIEYTDHMGEQTSGVCAREAWPSRSTSITGASMLEGMVFAGWNHDGS